MTCRLVINNTYLAFPLLYFASSGKVVPSVEWSIFSWINVHKSKNLPAQRLWLTKLKCRSHFFWPCHKFGGQIHPNIGVKRISAHASLQASLKINKENYQEDFFEKLAMKMIPQKCWCFSLIFRNHFQWWMWILFFKYDKW